MVLYGTLMNALLIVIGTLVGLLLHRIPDSIKNTTMQAIGLIVIVIGIKMAIQVDNTILILLSLFLGAICGTAIQLENKMNALGHRIEKKWSKSNKKSITEAFITSSLIYVVGAMSIIGALNSGLSNDHEILITKGFLDGFMSLVLTTTLGYGVIFSIIPVILYQGSIALFAEGIHNFINSSILDSFTNEMTALGGVLILAIGTNILGLTKIKIGDFLPAIPVFILLFFLQLNVF
ncbi:hypothetical protein GGQ92_002186 [Gracilibacillus halotolerans]|uniref:DUF554 domain-containing protein n=1 Tax=Gracilibacillus halotolerans TaxID=74386 RepID=A0A841RS21_9BACI|nr:DUF554 domain-containing protein [Gracilibacillus halotolerans]MBB6513378.1 hypothetical protein [Gracilibacillus halotolerans]